MENLENKRITFRATPVMHAKLEERARMQKVGVNDVIRSAISRELAERADGSGTVQVQLDAMQSVLARIAESVVAFQRRQDEIERLCASAVAAAALLLDSGSGPEAQAQERIKGHVRNSLAAAQAVLLIRNSAAAPAGRASN